MQLETLNVAEAKSERMQPKLINNAEATNKRFYARFLLAPNVPFMPAMLSCKSLFLVVISARNWLYFSTFISDPSGNS